MYTLEHGSFHVGMSHSHATSIRIIQVCVIMLWLKVSRWLIWIACFHLTNESSELVFHIYLALLVGNKPKFTVSKPIIFKGDKIKDTEIDLQFILIWYLANGR